jgi:uncharacterized protein
VSRENVYDRYARLVTSAPRSAIALVLLSVLALGFCARHVRLDNNFAALFSSSSEAARFREAYRATFGADDGLLVAALESEQPADPRFVSLVEKASRRVADDPDVRRVYSPTETSIVLRSGDSAVIEPAFGSASSAPGGFDERLARVLASPLGGPRLLSRDGRVQLVVAELDPGIDSYERIVAPAQRFTDRITQAVDEAGLPVQVRYAGIPFTRIAAIASMQGDLVLLTPLTTLALALILALFLRRALAVLIPLSCVTAAVVGTAGVIGLCGDDLNQLTVVYPILLMVVTVATAIHQVHRFQLELASGKLSVVEAARVAAARTTEASMLQTVTTVFGFGSLITSSMHILHGFGVYLAAGVTLAFVYIATLVPATLALWGRHVALPAAAAARHTSGVARGSALVRAMVSPRGSLAITGASLAAFGLLAYLSRDIVYDYRLSNNVPHGHGVEAGNALMDGALSGIVPIEVSLRGPPEAFREPAALAKVDELTRYLGERGGVRVPISLASVVRELSRAFGGDGAIPRDRETVAQLLLFGDGSPDRVISQLASPDFAETRIRGTIPDLGARHVAALEAAFAAHAREVLRGTELTARMTGEAPVAYQGMNRLSEELLTSELWALVLVTLAIGVVFRSVRVALASVLPNALPVLVALSLYALTGRAIDPLPGIVFCIGIGIAVDDTIHLIARYREELARCPDPREAMVTTMAGMGGALLSSSASIAAGFAVLCLSDFDMNRTMGWLGALMLGLAFVFEWLCTPAALVLFGGHGRAAAPASVALAAGVPQ